jgi:hypothetical protein
VIKEQERRREERVWQVRLPNGSAWIAPDSRPDDPRASWIYARSTADMFAEQLGGTVVEVARRQKESILDKEIAFALNEPKPPPKTKTPKTRARPFGHAARRAIATAILENVPLNNAARSAVDTARETANDGEYKAALRTLKAALPTALWVGHDVRRDQGLVQSAEPVWITDDPDGEDPKHWREIALDEIVALLVEAL